MKKITEIIPLAFALVCLMAGLPAHAEKADRSKPINVEADTVKVDEVRKSAIYEGHVVMTQGTLSITADRIEVQQDDKGVVSGLASGRPAHFRQKMEASSEYAEGWAERIEYESQGEKLKLTGQARLKRGIDELRGNQITYDSSSELFQARGSTAGSSPGSTGRVRAIIRPRADAEGDAAATPAPVKSP